MPSPKYCLLMIQFLTLTLILSKFLWLIAVQGQEMARRRTSNVCKNNSQCPSNAYCELQPGSLNGQCVCHCGHIIIAENGHRECYESALTIGSDCVFNEQCMITLSTESECFLGHCRCKQDTHYIKRENTCYKSVKIGDYCRLTNNCIGDGTICRSGKCHCPINKHSNIKKTDCIDDVQLEEKCEYSEECITENAKCFSTCQCDDNYISNKNKTKCLKVANYLHENCMEDIQCTENFTYSICDSNKQTCECRYDSHELHDKCWVSVPLGGVCEADENCALVNNSYCKEGRCTCTNSLKLLNGICSLGHQIFNNQRILLITIFITIIKNIFLIY